MNRVMSLIGSASGCKFRLDDPSVAPFHCCLVRTSQGLWVVDLLGHEGTYVNDSAVRFDPAVRCRRPEGWPLSDQDQQPFPGYRSRTNRARR